MYHNNHNSLRSSAYGVMMIYMIKNDTSFASVPGRHYSLEEAVINRVRSARNICQTGWLPGRQYLAS